MFSLLSKGLLEFLEVHILRFRDHMQPQFKLALLWRSTDAVTMS